MRRSIAIAGPCRHDWNPMIRHLSLCFAAAMLTPVACLSQNAFAVDRGLCDPDESSVFICQNGSKTASLCAKKANDGLRLRYVFGARERIELSYPAPSVAPRDAFRQGNIMYSGIGGEYIRFSQGPFDYSIFYVLGAGTSFRGVVVERDKKHFSNLVCAGKSDDELTTPLFDELKLPQIEQYDFDVPQVFWNDKK
jgi:hypothetical protein